MLPHIRHFSGWENLADMLVAAARDSEGLAKTSEDMHDHLIKLERESSRMWRRVFASLMNDKIAEKKASTAGGLPLVRPETMLQFLEANPSARVEEIHAKLLALDPTKIGRPA